jgi:hypothetical protein
MPEIVSNKLSLIGQDTSPWSILPSWLASVIVHVAIFVFCMTSLRSCGGDFSGQTGEQFHEVGIYVRDSQVSEVEKTQEQVTDVTERVVEPVQTPSIDPTPPAEITLPENDISIVGAGAPVIPSSAIPTGVPQMLTPGRVRPSGQPGLGEGQTTFFDIRESADRFVYLIDSSASMYGPRMRFAASQLKASLRQLNAKQQFQVVFYNNGTHTMSLRSKPGAAWYRATSANISDAIRFIDSASPDGGTEHGPALRQVLKYRPQVLFFLTDGSEPLTRGELESISNLNSGRTRIHCVKFDELGDLGLDNWLKKLARANGGSYRYQDVLNLRR